MKLFGMLMRPGSQCPGPGGGGGVLLIQDQYLKCELVGYGKEGG